MRTACYGEEASKAAANPPYFGKRSAQVRRDRRREGSKPHGRDSTETRGAAREPDGSMQGRIGDFLQLPAAPADCFRHVFTARYPRPGSTTSAPDTDAARQRKTGRDLEQVVKLGLGASIDGDTDMQRELIEIEADNDGWTVKDFVSVLPCKTKAKAILEGHRLAERRYRDTGHPTAIKVPVGWGETVMVGAWG